MDRDGIFAGNDPYEILRRWLAEAEQSEPADANAMSLATVDADGLPNVRIVLLKDIEPDGLIFYTNYNSTKAVELTGAAKAACGFHWKSLGRQIKARGRVEKVSAEISDAYFNSRPLESRLGAWASQQSRPLEDRAELEAQLAEVTQRLGDAPPRPPHWGGFRLVPEQFEFWCQGANRLHDRFHWNSKSDNGFWIITRLNP